jgi:putative phosphoesterase
MSTRILVTSDTHIPDFARALPPALPRAASRADLILHAGDATAADVLAELAAYAPLLVALGNNDRADVATFGAVPEISLTVEELGISMVHDAGPRGGRERRLARRFPDAGLVVFGHSHIPMVTELDGRRFLNPGSPTWKRRQPHATYATVTVDAGRTRIRIVEL